MKKQRLLTAFTCISLVIFLSGCSLNENFSDAPSSDTETIGELDTDNKSPADTTDPEDNISSGNDFSTNPEKPAESPEIQSTEGYVMSVDGNTMYVDLENTGGRTYPGEGEDRKVAFDISDAEQIQTNISEVYPARNHLIRSGIHVDIEYYVQNGVNIATKLTSDSVELGLVVHISDGYVTAITESSITVYVTDLENSGKTLDFDLSDCDSFSENITIDSIVSVTYYIKRNINYAIGVVCLS